jgi:hypothetical protein
MSALLPKADIGLASARTPQIAAICKVSWTTHCNREHDFTAIDSGRAHYNAQRLYFCRRYDRCDCVARGCGLGPRRFQAIIGHPL